MSEIVGGTPLPTIIEVGSLENPTMIEVGSFENPVVISVDVKEIGAQGKSAYRVWLEQGNVGTEAEFLLTLKGKTGDSLDYAWQGTSLGVKTTSQADYTYVNLAANINATVETFVYDRQQPLLEWNIIHPMTKYPSVTVVDTAGSIVIGEVLYVSLSQIIITFSSEFSGRAYLN